MEKLIEKIDNLALTKNKGNKQTNSRNITIECESCGKRGHSKYDCWIKKTSCKGIIEERKKMKIS